MPPKLSPVRRDDTHRLVPCRNSRRSVLERLTERAGDLSALIDLEGATNDRLLGEANLLPGIGVHELLYGIPYAHIVNAAFCHAHPMGSRFNGPDRGAWYAAFDLETARAEVAFHKRRELQDVGWEEPEEFVFDDYLADFRAEFHDLRSDPRYRTALDSRSYRASQRLAAVLIGAGSAGLVYPSVRRTGGTCLVCFRPALVANVRKGAPVTLTWPAR